jgi:RNA recognition motif-containing protein
MNMKESVNNVDARIFYSLRKRGDSLMATTLYVGNLPWSATEDSLTDAFGSHGQVISSRIITDKETGRSRGFGFVEVEDQDVDAMVSAMNGADMEGRQIVVNEAKPRQN